MYVLQLNKKHKVCLMNFCIPLILSHACDILYISIYIYIYIHIYDIYIYMIYIYDISNIYDIYMSQTKFERYVDLQNIRKRYNLHKMH